MRNILIALAIFSTITSVAFSQGNQSTQIILNNDSTSLRSLIVNAQWQVHSRSFFLSTINEGALKDDYTCATDAGLGMLTEPYKGFQLGMSGFGMLHVKYQPSKQFTIHVCDGLFENMMKNAVVELKTEQKLISQNHTFYQGVMLVHQDAIRYGGIQDPKLTHMTKGGSSNVFGI